MTAVKRTAAETDGRAAACAARAAGPGASSAGVAVIGGGIVESPSDPDTVRRCRRTVGGHVPSLGAVRVERAWAGVIDCTPGLLPIPGPVVERDDRCCGTGFSGHGFAVAPPVRPRVAEWLADGQPSRGLDALAYARCRARDLRVPGNLI